MSREEIDNYLEKKGKDVLDLISDFEVQEVFNGYDNNTDIKEHLDKLIQSKRLYKLKSFRETTGLSQKEFSDYFGISVRTLQGWEQGRRIPSDYLIPLLVRLWSLEHNYKG